MAVSHPAEFRKCSSAANTACPRLNSSTLVPTGVTSEQPCNHVWSLWKTAKDVGIELNLMNGSHKGRHGFFIPL